MPERNLDEESYSRLEYCLSTVQYGYSYTRHSSLNAIKLYDRFEGGDMVPGSGFRPPTLVSRLTYYCHCLLMLS